ncbi:MAG: biotin/lipoyl-binding protein [Propionibacteriaceae bacterium]|nr:biotin/lipoyl-binding protein [Propionibacteriaceae bacterium]
MVEAFDGEVSQSVSTAITATWPRRNVALNQASGTITRLPVAEGQQVQAGDVLYWVDERPVVILSGEVPSFRALARGAVGRDVTQLTDFLVTRDLIATSSPRYDGRVQAAVRAWQQQLGVPATGELHRGDIVFVPTLPLNFSPGEDLAVGQPVSAGEPAIHALAEYPSITATFGDLQARLVSAGKPVQIAAPPHTWTGILGTPSVANGVTTAEVTGPDGGSVCADECTAIPTAGTTALTGDTEIQPTVTGVVVPVAALVSLADGGTAVLDRDGLHLPVTVTARAKGMAVVTGLASGTAVRVPAP